MKHKTQFELKANRLTIFYSSVLDLVNAPDKDIERMLEYNLYATEQLLARLKVGGKKPKNYDEQFEAILNQSAMLKAVVKHRNQEKDNALN